VPGVRTRCCFVAPPDSQFLLLTPNFSFLCLSLAAFFG